MFSLTPETRSPMAPNAVRGHRASESGGRGGNYFPRTLLYKHIGVQDADEVALDEFFGDLHGVEGGALADIVGHDPHIQAVFDAFVFADAAHEHFVFTGGVHGQRVEVGAGIVHDLHAGGLGEEDAGLGGGELLFGLDVHGFGVAVEHGHAHAGGGNADVRIEHLMRFVHHLHFFLGVVVVHEDVDVGKAVEGDLEPF